MLQTIERPGESFLYNFYTAFVTTLGGTVLGSALIGLCSALLSFLLCKALRKKTMRCVLGMIGCGCIIGATASCLPGWEIKPGMETALFLTALCFLVTVINEYTLNDKITDNPG